MNNQIKFLLLILIALLFVQCANDELPGEMMGEVMVEDDGTVFFSKANGADPTSPASQDRITDNVWITRGNEGMQIYNIRTETVANVTSSPAGVRWAVGTTADMANLTFDNLRNTVRPQRIVGENLVMELVEDGIFLDVVFSQWTQGNANGGGFAYTRTEL